MSPQGQPRGRAQCCRAPRGPVARRRPGRGCAGARGVLRTRALAHSRTVCGGRSAAGQRTGRAEGAPLAPKSAGIECDRREEHAFPSVWVSPCVVAWCQLPLSGGPARWGVPASFGAVGCADRRAGPTPWRAPPAPGRGCGHTAGRRPRAPGFLALARETCLRAAPGASGRRGSSARRLHLQRSAANLFGPARPSSLRGLGWFLRFSSQSSC